MEFVIPGCKREPPSRMAANTIHLTYAALYPGELDFDTLLAAAKSWGRPRHGLREYAIGREKHSTPADPQRDEHFHAYIKLGKKVDINDRFRTTSFDLRGRNGRVLHPEVQPSSPPQPIASASYGMTSRTAISWPSS